LEFIIVNLFSLFAKKISLLIFRRLLILWVPVPPSGDGGGY
jgi:hypothetical protein